MAQAMASLRAQLDRTVLCMWPYSQKHFTEHNREVCVRRGIVNREQSDRFEGSDDLLERTLPDLSGNLKAILTSGERHNRAILIIWHAHSHLLGSLNY